MNWKQMIQAFEHHLKIERGLSENTIKGYAADLKKLDLWIKTHKITHGPEKISAQSFRILSTIRPKKYTFALRLD